MAAAAAAAGVTPPGGDDPEVEHWLMVLADKVVQVRGLSVCDSVYIQLGRQVLENVGCGCRRRCSCGCVGTDRQGVFPLVCGNLFAWNLLLVPCTSVQAAHGLMLEQHHIPDQWEVSIGSGDVSQA